MSGFISNLWTAKEDETLLNMRRQGFGIAAISRVVKRSRKGVEARLKRLEANADEAATTEIMIRLATRSLYEAQLRAGQVYPDAMRRYAERVAA